MEKYTFSIFDVPSDRMHSILTGESRNMFRLLDIRDEHERVFTGLNHNKTFDPAYHWYVTCAGECKSDNDIEFDKILTFSVYRVHHGLKMVAMAVRSRADDTLDDRRMIHASLIEHIRVMSKISWVEGGEVTECVFRYALGVQSYIFPSVLIDRKIYKSLRDELGLNYHGIDDIEEDQEEMQ